MKRIRTTLFSLFALVLLASIGAGNLFAQSCSISSTATSAGTRSTTCFVKAGNQTIMTLSGTWVGTMQIQVSQDGGVNWTVIETDTGNINTVTPKYTADVRFAWFPFAYTSGTVSYTINDITPTFGKIKYSNIPIGSVAYASLGTSTAGSSTVTMSTDIFVESDFTSTGVGILIGATGGTDTFTIVLRDSTGKYISKTASTTAAAGANAFQEIPWLNVLTNLPRGRYYVDVQTSGATATTRRIATATFVDTTAAETTGTVYGTVPTFLVEPTTFTALKAPVMYLY